MHLDFTASWSKVLTDEIKGADVVIAADGKYLPTRIIQFKIKKKHRLFLHCSRHRMEYIKVLPSLTIE